MNIVGRGSKSFWIKMICRCMELINDMFLRRKKKDPSMKHECA